MSTVRIPASCNCYQRSFVPPASTLPLRQCRPTPARFFMTARAAASVSSQSPVIAVSSALTAQSRARRSNRTGSVVEVPRLNPRLHLTWERFLGRSSIKFFLLTRKSSIGQNAYYGW
jgi:hypothetical protein